MACGSRGKLMLRARFLSLSPKGKQSMCALAVSHAQKEHAACGMRDYNKLLSEESEQMRVPVAGAIHGVTRDLLNRSTIHQ